MGNIYTKKGDGGETSLIGGERISKDSIKVECYGTIDEANSMIGLAKALSKDETIIVYLEQIQKKLFIVASELASTEKAKKTLKEKIENEDVSYLENIIDKCTLLLGQKNEFTTPGVDILSATLHIARTIIRRAERHIIKLNKIEELNSKLVKYINRLSDCIYILARYQEERYLINLIKEKVLEKVNALFISLIVVIVVSLALGCGAKTTELPAAIMPIVLHITVSDGFVLGVIAPITPKGESSINVRPLSPAIASVFKSSIPGVFSTASLFFITLSLKFPILVSSTPNFDIRLIFSSLISSAFIALTNSSFLAIVQSLNLCCPIYAASTASFIDLKIPLLPVSTLRF